MGENTKPITSSCSFMSVQPIMADLPYPPLQVKERNQAYANLLSIDYCGAVSELSATTQYINNENRLAYDRCSAAKTILGIAMAEMIHLQKLGELICMLGGQVDFTAKYQNGGRRMWTPEYITIPENIHKMLSADIEAEKEAVRQYRMHMDMIRDEYVNAVLARIIKDEEYHIILLQWMMKEL